MEAGAKKQGSERFSYLEAHRTLLSFKSVCAYGPRILPFLGMRMGCLEFCGLAITVFRV